MSSLFEKKDQYFIFYLNVRKNLLLYLKKNRAESIPAKTQRAGKS